MGKETERWSAQFMEQNYSNNQRNNKLPTTVIDE